MGWPRNGKQATPGKTIRNSGSLVLRGFQDEPTHMSHTPEH